MIRIRGLKKRYKHGKVVNEVLHGVDLDVVAQEMVALVGPSGSGKTTLLHTIGGLDADYEGSVEVEGQDLQRMNDVALSRYRNRTVGLVFQSFYLLPHLSSVENVALPAMFSRDGDTLTRAAALARAREVLGEVDLADKVDAVPGTLSGGQRQRVAIARALFNRPRLLLCDEPTGNLDSKMGATIIEFFARLNRESAITILIVTHDPNVAASAGRVVSVVDGRLTVSKTSPSPEARA
jgi:ABC-type lipoprotein export system ATPase subunit